MRPTFLKKSIIALTVLFCYASPSYGQIEKAPRLPSLPYNMISKYLPETMALVFNDESEDLYGDLLKNRLHVDLVCKALNMMAKDRPKAIFIDIDVAINPKAAACISETAIQLGLRVTLDFDPTEVVPDLSQFNGFISVGYAQVLTNTMSDSGFTQRPTSGSGWLAPKTRVNLVKPAVIPFRIPAYFVALVQGLPEQDLRKLNYSWNRKITLAEFSESQTPKISIQEVLAGKTDALADKYVVIGVDQDKYDAFSNPQGEIVNGMFIHQQFIAAYLSLMNENVIPADGEMIIFGEPVGL